MLFASRSLLLVAASVAALSAPAQTTVQSIVPADGATGVAPGTSIVVTFSTAMGGSTLTTQTGAGACSGNIQVSSDGFATCIAFSAGTAATTGAIATLTPVPNLALASTYRVRVLAAASSLAAIPMAADVTQATGFTTMSATPALLGVRSRKSHGTAGIFDIPVDATQPVGGAITVEPRLAGAGHTIIFQFDGPVTATGTVSAVDEVGTPVGSANAIPSGNSVVLTATNVPDKQRVAFQLSGVNNSAATALASVGFFAGAVGGFRSVTALDIAQVKNRSGQAVDEGNFRHDVNTSGTVTAADILAVKRRSNVVYPATFTVGGSIAGLAGTLVLQNNGGDTLSLSANGAFTFPVQVNAGAGYAVSVFMQPAGQLCSVANATGTISNAPVGNVAITCMAALFSIGGAVGGSVTQGVMVALSGARAATTVTNMTGAYSFSGLPPGSYQVTPILGGQVFVPPNRAVVLSNANSATNSFTASPAPPNPTAPVVGLFFEQSQASLPPAARDLVDGTKVLLKYTILLPDNCPQRVTVANLGPGSSTLNYQVVNEDFTNGFVYINGSNGLTGGGSIPVTFSFDPQFTTGPFGGPSLSLGSTQIFSILTPQAANNTKSIISVDVRSPADLLIGTWQGTWSGMSEGLSTPGNPTPTTPVNGSWTLQIDSADLATGLVGGSLTWTGTDAVWSSDGMTPSPLPVNRTLTFTPQDSLVQAAGFGCGMVRVSFNTNFTNPPSNYGPNGGFTLDLPKRVIDMSSLFHSNPLWPSGATGHSTGSMTGTKTSP